MPPQRGNKRSNGRRNRDRPCGATGQDQKVDRWWVVGCRQVLPRRVAGESGAQVTRSDSAGEPLPKPFFTRNRAGSDVPDSAGLWEGSKSVCVPEFNRPPAPFPQHHPGTPGTNRLFLSGDCLGSSGPHEKCLNWKPPDWMFFLVLVGPHQEKQPEIPSPGAARNPKNKRGAPPKTARIAGSQN